MDLLRGGSVLLIVAWHAIAVPIQFGIYEPPGLVLGINKALSPYRVPLLLVLSGTLVPRGALEGPRRFATGKLARILWPLVVWQTTFALILVEPQRLTVPVLWLGGMLWFLGTLVICYAVAWVRILREPIVRVPWIALAVLLFAWLSTGIQTVPAIDRALWGCLLFFIGASIPSLIDVIQNRMQLLLVGALALAAAVGTLEVARGQIFYQNLAVLPTTICGVLVLLWMAPRLTGNPFSRLLEWYGRQSVVVYVAHPAAMYIAIRFLQSRGVELGDALPLLMLIVGFALLTVLIAMRPWTGWLFEFPLRTSQPARPEAHAAGGSR